MDAITEWNLHIVWNWKNYLVYMASNRCDGLSFIDGVRVVLGLVGPVDCPW